MQAGGVPYPQDLAWAVVAPGLGLFTATALSSCSLSPFLPYSSTSYFSGGD